MRFVFADPLCTKEMQYRNEMVRKMDEFWEAFIRDQGMLLHALEKKQTKPLIQWINNNLFRFPGFQWESGPTADGTATYLAITPESQRHLRPLAETLIACAPDLPEWQFYAYRPAMPLEVALGGQDTRLKFKTDPLTVHAVQNAREKMDLIFYSPEFTEQNENNALNDALIHCEQFLGEEVLDFWIGAIDARPAAEMPEEAISIRQLPEVVARMRSDAQQRLPDRPCWKWRPQAEWSLYEFNTPTAEIFGLGERYVWSTMLPTMMRNTFGGLFASERFSRFGEAFCYLKVDGGESVKEQYKTIGYPLEDAINVALTKAELGCCCGRGIGAKHWFLEFALTDVPKAIEFLRDIAQRFNLPRRAWLLFHDSALSQEWVGLWQDTPPPALPPIE